MQIHICCTCFLGTEEFFTTITDAHSIAAGYFARNNNELIANLAGINAKTKTP